MTARVTYSEGNCTSRDRNELRAGQLVASTGGYYAPGDPVRLRKYGGRSSFATLAAGTPVSSLALCQFDGGTGDALLGLTGTTIKTSSPTSGSFSNLVTSLNASTVKLSATHYNNRWYLATGYDRNKVLESDGTTRGHGMIAPQQQLTAVASLAGTTVKRPTVSVDVGPLSWSNREFAYDDASIIDTFSRATASVVTGSSYVASWTTFGSNTDSARTLNVVWSIHSSSQNATGSNSGERPDVGTGGLADLGARVDIKIEYSVDSGSNWTTLVQETGISSASLARRVSQVPISNAVNSNTVQVKATFTYQSGSSTVSMRIYDINIKPGYAPAFSTTTGMYYAVTEFDSLHGALESPASPVTSLVTLSAQNIVTLTMPNTTGTAAPQNSNATHWRIYRTTDNGTSPQGLYLIGEIPIAQITFVDDFLVYPSTVLGTHFYPLLRQQADTGVLYFPRDTAPPRFDFMTYYRGSVVGITHDKPRTLFYSFAGRPESFPEIYVHENFPFPERDVLVCAQPCGDSLIVAGKQLMMTMDDLPRVGNTGTFSAVNVRPLRGQPGVVNQDAMVSYSVNGEPRVAWISRYGLHETNGTTSRKISGDMAWPPTSTEAALDRAILFYDAQSQVLIMAYDTGSGYNDRWAMFHMSPDQATNEGLPKWTGPHYGPFSAMAAGIVSSAYVRWSGLGGGSNSGIVYTENSGGTDASQSYSSTLLPFIVTTPRVYGDNEQDYAVYKANLRHSGFAGDTMAVSWVSGRDQTGATQTASKSLTLTGQAGTDMFIGIGGEWHQVTLTHTGANRGFLLDIRFEPMTMGWSGRVA